MKIKPKRSYQIARAQEYPSVGEQLDAAMKGFEILFTTPAILQLIPPSKVADLAQVKAWIKSCQDVKTKIKKPASQ